MNSTESPSGCRSDSTRSRTVILIVLLAASSLFLGAWELVVTRVASILFFYDVAYLILSISLFALAFGAIASRFIGSWDSVRGLVTGLITSIILAYPTLYWFEMAWFLCLFAIPFFIFGVLTAVVWRQVVDIRYRTWLYGSELAGAVIGLLVAGPMIIANLPVNVLGDIGVSNHLKETINSEGFVSHSYTTSSVARTDFLETTRSSVKYAFTDGMFVTRSVAWDGEASDFADPHVEELARLKRFVFHINDAKRVVLLGSGAGFDMTVALQEGAEEITAIEVNPATVNFARSHDAWAGGVLANPQVNVVIAEARRFMEQNTDTWDQVNLTLMQTSPAGVRGVQHMDARVLTVEAVHTYLSRLSETGVIAVIQNTIELASATGAVAVSALGEGEGQVLRFQLQDFPDNPFTYLIVIAPDPFTAAQLAAIEERSKQFGIERVDSFGDPALSIATDDQPFFFVSGTRMSLRALLILAFTLFATGLLLVVFRHQKGVGSISIAALLIGTATMAVQVLALYWCDRAIGSPTLAMATALAAVLAGAGVGVLLFGRWLEVMPWWQTGFIAAAWILVMSSANPLVTGAAVEVSSSAAATLMGAYLLLFSLPLGLPFVATMQQARSLQHGESIVIGYDGLGAVLGTAGATLVAMTLGFLLLGYVIVLGFAVFTILAYLVSKSRD